MPKSAIIRYSGLGIFHSQKKKLGRYVTEILQRHRREECTRVRIHTYMHTHTSVIIQEVTVLSCFLVYVLLLKYRQTEVSCKI